MPSRTATTALLLLLSLPYLLAAGPPDYLPGDVRYDPQVSTPQEYLGFRIGRRHLRHDQLVGYLRRVAETSPRVKLEEYARSYGGRPLVMLTITSPRNHRRLNRIRRDSLRLADPAKSDQVDIARLPAVLNMGYGVHGNEPSASNVAPLVAYYLAAARSDEVEEMLDRMVVLLDPCLNPDGFDRFAHWVNRHRGKVLNPDKHTREHQEGWPSGRTNYYWFDLNRDWLPLVHPESRGRMAVYQSWKPNVVLDFHEMGSDATYFFQPGVPARNNPLTPPRVFDLTRRLAARHARALDRRGTMYYTEEGFDDFYMGKGSTYPDLQGAVGILFEQASSRGHFRESDNGRLTFHDCIENQWTTSMSSLRGTLALREQLHRHQRDFYKQSLALAKKSKVKAHLVSAPHDPVRLHAFADILRRHRIGVHRLANKITIDNQVFSPGESLVIPTEQPEYRYLTALLERRTKFRENVFYDVSAWTLPLAFNLKCAELKQPLPQGALGEVYQQKRPAKQPLALEKDDVAYLVDWRGYRAAKVLYRLLDAGVLVKTATREFTAKSGGKKIGLPHGTLLIPLGAQPEKRKQIRRILRAAAEDTVDVYPVKTFLTPRGIDLGSRIFAVLNKPRVLLVVGEGVNQYEAGEVWHLLDRRVKMPVTLVDTHRLGGVELSRYNAMVVVGGDYDLISSGAVKKLRAWLSAGGTLIGIGKAAQWIDSVGLADVEFVEAPAGENDSPRPYDRRRKDRALQLVRGAIFEAHVDTTHPLGYGVRLAKKADRRDGFPRDGRIALFRNNRVYFKPGEERYSRPLAYTRAPLLAGYASERNIRALLQSTPVLIQSAGDGRVILLAENPNFRAFWYGTNRLFFNAVFFGGLVGERG